MHVRVVCRIVAKRVSWLHAVKCAISLEVTSCLISKLDKSVEISSPNFAPAYSIRNEIKFGKTKKENKKA